MYGIRLLLPFSGEWFRADTTNVIDLWILAVIAIGIAGPFLARLVGSEISSGPARDRHHGRGFAWFALLFLLAYDCGRGVLHARAVAALGSHLYDDAAPLRVAALPGFGQPAALARNRRDRRWVRRAGPEPGQPERRGTARVLP